MSQNNRSEFSALVLGIIEVIAADVVLVLVFSLLILIFSSLSAILGNLMQYVGGLLIFGIFGIGVSQLLFVVPRAIVLSRQRKWAEMKGVIIGAVIIALLNGGCWFLILSAYR